MSGDITIAIDGGAGTGKGTTAQGVAHALGYRYVDTGAMYRAVTLYLIEHDIALDDQEAIETVLHDIQIDFRNDALGLNQTYLNGENVEQTIRNIRVSRHVAQVAAFPAVRAYLVAQQQAMANAGAMVMDGRDIGSVIAPGAELKVYLTADLNERARRRQLQLKQKGEIHDLETIKENLRMRDEIDYTGETPTSWIAPDARALDTTSLTIDEQIAQVVEWAKELIDK